jgi:hypothetical protein
MMFELMPFGVVVPDWLMTAVTITLWLCLVGAVLHLARGTDT